MGQRDGYHFVRCRSCGHLFVTRLPGEEVLREVYHQYSYEAQALAAVPPFVFQRLREMLRPFDRVCQTGRLLDVGFGAGCTLVVARELGWQPYGIEASALAVEQARRNGFEEVTLGSLLDAPYPDGYFDVVTMYELVEHLTEPRAFVEKAARLLRSGGVLHLSTPNGTGVSARQLGTGWSVVAPPEHINLFSPRSIEMLLRGAGFGQVRVSTAGVNPSELVRAAKQRIAPPARDSTEPASRFPPVSSYEINRRLIGSRTGRLVKATANALLAATRLGDAMKVTAIRAADGMVSAR